MSPKNKVVMGVDIGGTKIACALISDGRIVSEIKKVTTPHGSKILDEVEAIYKSFSSDNIISGIGISTAGMVDDNGKIVGSAGNLPGWEGINARETLNKHLNIPIVIENDANAAAFAEYQVGNSRGANPMILVILGTGVGGGIVINGKLVRGANYAGGEIGHYPLGFTKERLCACGKYDCFEAYASGNGVLALIKKYFPDKHGSISTRKLFEIIETGSNEEKTLAQKAIDEWHFYVALGTSILIQTFDPKKVVYSGGMASQLNIDYLTIETQKLLIPALREPVANGVLEKSILKNDAGLIGAALLVSQHVELTLV